MRRAVLLRVAPVRRDGAFERGGVVLRHVRRLRVAGHLHALGAAVLELREPRAHLYRGFAAMGAVLRKKIQAWAEGDPHRAIVAAPQKGNTAVPPCQVVCEGPVPAGRARAVTAVNVLADVALLAVFVLSCMSVVSSSYNPFIYFQF